MVVVNTSQEWKMTTFTPVPSLLGGALIGLSASMMLLLSGRIAGISGILGTALRQPGAEGGWRPLFLGGMLLGGLALHLALPGAFSVGVSRSPAALIAAGLLVGYGTRLGNGCTSGHGVCGLSRLSARSLGATLTFMATGALAAFVVSRFFGGAI